MILITDELRARLLANGAAEEETDHVPVVKLFDPTGPATWLLTELAPDGDTLFGLCDLGFGCPELGSVSLAELESVKGAFGLGIERDLHFEARFRSMPTPRAVPAISRRPRAFCGTQQPAFQIPIPSFRPMRRESSAASAIPSPPRRLSRRAAGQSQPKPRSKTMQLAHIPIDRLNISAVNMRHGKRPPDVSDILPSVRARGVLVPLLVRPNGEPDTFEIVAGRRRYFAAKSVADERGEADPLPCAVLEDGDDADALEASLIENIARLDPDEVSQWETFTRLIRQGRTVPDIAATFGLTELLVKRILALGDLLPKIREAYRREEIDVETARYLTMASKAQQKDWLMLFADPQQYAPRGYQLKQWLFGGQSIPTKVALFPLEDYPGLIVSDLFGEDSYFADADLFWEKQNAAIAARRDAYLEDGWAQVTVLEPGQLFHSWDHEKTPKKKGGKVFITVSHRGEVECHEGWLSRKEARRARAKGEGGDEADTPAKPSRPELTGPMQNYVDLHRHAAVRTAMLDHPGVALRMMVAHAITGSGLWQVRPEPQRAANETVAASVAGSKAEAAFAEKRRDVLALLGAPDDEGTVAGGNGDDYATARVFARLLALSDDDVMRVLAIVMGETLAAGSAVIEALGNHLKVDMGAWWQPDDAFFDLLRDKEIANAMLADVGGETVADGNVAEKVKTQKKIVRDFLAGENGRQKVEAWLPRWLKFPAQSYTSRGGFRTADQWAKVQSLFAAE